MKMRELRKANGEICRQSITVKEVLDILKRLKIEKSSGPDQIYAKPYWGTREEITRVPE